MSHAHAQVVQMTKMLKNLDRWLGKAVDHAGSKSFDAANLLQSRLAPDMFPLMRQLQSAADGVKFLAARLSGSEAPKHPDTETTLDEIRARIQAVIAYVEGIKPEQYAGADEREIKLGFLPGKAAYGADWAREFNIPNTYFHLVMAYAILRHNGVGLGKMDFIGSMPMHDIK